MSTRPDYLHRLLTASHPALASVGRLRSAWAPAPAPIRSHFMGQPVETDEERGEREQRWADQAAIQAEERFARFCDRQRVITDRQRSSAAHRRLDVALGDLRTMHLRNIK